MANEDEKPVLLQYVDAETAETLYSDEESAFRDFKNSFKTDDAMGILRVSRIRTSKFARSPQSLKGGAHCFSVPIDQYEFDELLEVLRERYGAGLYRLIGVQKGVVGTKFNRMIEIAEDQSNVASETVGVEIPSQGNIGMMMDTVSGMLADSQERTERMFEKFAPQAQIAADPFAMMAKMVEVMSTMGVIGGNRPDMLGELERFAKIQEMLGGMSSGGGGSENFFSLMTETIRQFGGPLLMAVKAGAEAGAISPTPPLRMPPPVTTEQPTETAVPTEPTAEQIKEFEALKTQVNILVANAKAGISAVDFAGVILNQTPDDQLEALHNHASRPDYLENLIKINPEVAEFRGWFQKLREEIIRLLDDMEIEETPPDPLPDEPPLHNVGDGVIVPPDGAVTDTEGNAAPDAPGGSGPKQTDPNDAAGAT